jgi:hypothetical protein
MASATTLPTLEKMQPTQQFAWALEEVSHLACYTMYFKAIQYLILKGNSVSHTLKKIQFLTLEAFLRFRGLLFLSLAHREYQARA